MKKNKESKKQKREYNKGTIFVKVMTIALIALMLLSACATLIFALV